MPSPVSHVKLCTTVKHTGPQALSTAVPRYGPETMHGRPLLPTHPLCHLFQLTSDGSTCRSANSSAEAAYCRRRGLMAVP